jgi:hypothetical protein
MRRAHGIREPGIVSQVLASVCLLGRPTWLLGAFLEIIWHFSGPWQNISEVSWIRLDPKSEYLISSFYVIGKFIAMNLANFHFVETQAL